MTDTPRLRAPAAIVLDLDGTVLDNSGLADAAAQACALVSGILGGLDPEALIAANIDAWAQVWHEVENACWLGEMDGYAAGREAWRRALEACGCNDASALEFAFSQYRRLAQGTFRLYSDVQGFLDYAAARGLSLGLVTNGPSDVQRDKIETLGISRHWPAPPGNDHTQQPAHRRGTPPAPTVTVATKPPTRTKPRAGPASASLPLNLVPVLVRGPPLQARTVLDLV